MDASELYDPEFRKLIKEKDVTIIIPVGSLEQHGAHLPITTDSDVVTEIASRLAKKCKFIVFPTISYGISVEHEPLFNTSSENEGFLQYLVTIVISLLRNNIESIIILNGHHGNIPIIETSRLRSMVRLITSKVPRAFQKLDLNGHETAESALNLDKLRSYSYWHYMNREFDHAGFVETSIMLAISDKVKMKKAKKGFTTKGLSDKEIQRIKKLSTQPGGFPQVTKNGVWGDPTNATKKDGEKFLAEIIRNLAKECQS